MNAEDRFAALFAPAPVEEDRPALPVNDRTAEPQDEPQAECGPAADQLPWQVLLVDDEPDIHAVLRLALQDVVVEGRTLHLITADSDAAARLVMATQPDIALILLDVVMETERAGLDLVRHIRNDLNNHVVQIILVTGQPGYAPQREVVENCEINGYRLKSELSADKIFVSVYTALRAARAMHELDQQRRHMQAQALALQQQQQHLAHYQQHLQELVLARTQALEESSRHLAETQFAMDRAGIAICWNDLLTGRFLYVNDEACRQLGYAREELLELTVADINPTCTNEQVAQIVESLRDSDHGSPTETLHRRKDGSLYPAEATLYVRRSPQRDWAIVFFSDISERRRAATEAQARMAELTRSNAALEATNSRLTQAQSQLLQSEKMASIGLLAAGVAHEINNPIGYVKSNMSSLVEYVGDFERMLDAYARTELRMPEHRSEFSEVRQLTAQIDFAYVRDDIRALLSESSSGLERVAKIVQDLKVFSRLDCEENWALDDIHQGLESTLNVIWNHLKYTCDVKREYGQLPPVECLLSQLNQIFLNLLVNAAQAIEHHGTIVIRTGCLDDQVWIEVADSGKGIEPQNLTRIFDPFYTTKPVGRGTGLGLSVSYSIVQKHHGRIEVESTVGKGTTFRVWLPVRQEQR